LHRKSFAPVWQALHPQEALAFMLEETGLAADVAGEDGAGGAVIADS
jgi:hypothetical protein